MKREAWRCCWKAPKAAAAANGLAAEANGLAEAAWVWVSDEIF